MGGGVSKHPCLPASLRAAPRQTVEELVWRGREGRGMRGLGRRGSRAPSARSPLPRLRIVRARQAV